VTETALVDDRASIAEHVRGSAGRLTAQERKAAQALLMNYPRRDWRRWPNSPNALGSARRPSCGLSPSWAFSAIRTSKGNCVRNWRRNWPRRSPSPRAKPGRAAPNARSSIRSPKRPSPICKARSGIFARTIFSAIVDLLCDRRRSVHLIGGRFTDALARYLAAHLSLVRPDVRHVPSGIGVWRDRLLDIKRRDVLVVFDIRRYQEDVVAFARDAAARGPEIVLVTDQWISPISRQAKHVLACRVAAPSRWDSSVVLWRSWRP